MTKCLSHVLISQWCPVRVRKLEDPVLNQWSYWVVFPYYLRQNLELKKPFRLREQTSSKLIRIKLSADKTTPSSVLIRGPKTWGCCLEPAPAKRQRDLFCISMLRNKLNTLQFHWMELKTYCIVEFLMSLLLKNVLPNGKVIQTCQSCLHQPLSKFIRELFFFIPHPCSGACCGSLGSEQKFPSSWSSRCLEITC